jgi:SspJ family small acid-soluble spore protein
VPQSDGRRGERGEKDSNTLHSLLEDKSKCAKGDIINNNSFKSFGGLR